MGLFSRIKKLPIFNGFSQLDDDFYEELEESLIMADMGMEAAEEAVEALKERCKQRKIKDQEGARACMREILAETLSAADTGMDLSRKPAVVLFIGVNGVGKTTTIGKLAARWKKEGKRVLLAAGDTFRAAAADQLTIWAERAGVEIVKQHEGADPASVVYDALTAARARSADVVLVDTAGRLHNKANLMNELNKISRVIDREHGAERAHPGQAVQGQRGTDGHRADQAGRHGQGRHCGGHRQGAGPAGEVRGPGRGRGRSAAL